MRVREEKGNYKISMALYDATLDNASLTTMRVGTVLIIGASFLNSSIGPWSMEAIRWILGVYCLALITFYSTSALVLSWEIKFREILWAMKTSRDSVQKLCLEITRNRDHSLASEQFQGDRGKTIPHVNIINRTFLYLRTGRPCL